MASVKEKVAASKAVRERVEAGVAELQRGIKEKTAEMQRGTKEIVERFGEYAKEFWG